MIMKKSRTLLIQLDLSPVLDTIDQSALISLLELNFGTSGCALQWLSSYLSDRSWFVSVGGQRSQTMLCEYRGSSRNRLGSAHSAHSVLACVIDHRSQTSSNPIRWDVTDPGPSPLGLFPVIDRFGSSHLQYVDYTQVSRGWERSPFAVWLLQLSPLRVHAAPLVAESAQVYHHRYTGARQRSHGPFVVIDLDDVQIQTRVSSLKSLKTPDSGFRLETRYSIICTLIRWERFI